MLTPVDPPGSSPRRRHSSRKRRGRKRKISRSRSKSSQDGSSGYEEYYRSGRRRRKEQKLVDLDEGSEDSGRSYRRKKGMPKRRKTKEQKDLTQRKSWRERRAAHHAMKEGISSRASAYGPPPKRQVGYSKAYDPPFCVKSEDSPVHSDRDSEEVLDMEMSDEDDDEEFDFPEIQNDLPPSGDDQPPPLEALPPPSQVFKKNSHKSLPPPPILKKNRYDASKGSSYLDVIGDEVYDVADRSPVVRAREDNEVRETPPSMRGFKPPAAREIIHPSAQHERLIINGGIVLQPPTHQWDLNTMGVALPGFGNSAYRVQPPLVHQQIPNPSIRPRVGRGGFRQQLGEVWPGTYPGLCSSASHGLTSGLAPPYNGSFRGSMRGNLQPGFNRGRGTFLNNGKNWAGIPTPPPRQFANHGWQNPTRQGTRPQPRVQDDVLECFSRENVKPLVKTRKDLLRAGMNEALLRNSLRSSVHNRAKPSELDSPDFVGLPTNPSTPKWKQNLRAKRARLRRDTLNGQEEVVPLSSIIYDREKRQSEKASANLKSKDQEKETSSTVSCTSCGHHIKFSNRFCTKCGTKRS